MAVTDADTTARIAGVTSAGAAKWLQCVLADDGSNTGVLRVFQGDTPEISGEGALPVEIKGDYTDYDHKIEDLQSGSPLLIFSIGGGGRTKSIVRVLAQFETLDAGNQFELQIRRTIGGDVRDIIAIAASDPVNKKNFSYEGGKKVRPGESVYLVYNGAAAADLWLTVTTEEV